MRVVEIRTEEEFQTLREPWNALLAKSASDTIFLTWEWLTAWWSAYGNPGDLRILLAYDDEGDLCGIAPMRRTTVRRYGRIYSALTFVGDGSSDSDYLDLIIAAGEEQTVVKALWNYWAGERADGTLLQFNEIPSSSPNWPVLRALGASDGLVSAETDVPCGTVFLPGDWPEYLKKLAPRFRTKIRSVLRNLEARDGIRFHTCDERKQLDALLPVLYDLHAKRWATDAKPGVFRWNKKRTFYELLSPLLLERGWLRISSLEWKGKILACQYGLAYGTTYSQLQEGYNPTCEHWNVGVGLRAWSIQRFIQEGFREYDFLGGISRHKSDWGAETKLSKRLVLGRATAANTLFCRGPEWEARARQSVKRRIPERWIAARDARQEQHRRSAFDKAASLDGDWKRRLLLNCYYYSPLPAVLRPLRDRYRLELSGNGGSKVRLERRRQPSARILYYHRINDEGDPFFPAMTPAKFEEEMAAVARNFRVVSLREAVGRLTDGGPAEPVVVVTFDDGYEDNYRVAFPILQRYGIPATIFLTTGSLDSREPLWFERLALAVKKSPHEAIDLELDVPQRLSLRTESDRLKANNQIFWFLRNLPDSERQEQFRQILAILSATDDGERRSKMLTWDQVRWLQSHGVDFGGHTVTHPFVSRLSPEQLAWEAGECKRRIQEEVQIAVEHFAYPSGREIDFSPCSKQVVRDAGYRAAVSTLWGVNYPSTDPMELRRGQPWESQRAMFAAKLDWYQWLDA